MLKDALARLPRSAVALPRTDRSDDNEKGASSCQHSNTELPLWALMAVKLGLRGAAIGAIELIGLSNKLETAPRTLLLCISGQSYGVAQRDFVTGAKM